MPILKTDLNHRERKSYAAQLRQISESSSKLADALETENDDKALMEVLMLAISGETINALVRIFRDNLETRSPGIDPEGFDRIAKEINERK